MSDDLSTESSQGEVEDLLPDLAQLYLVNPTEWESMTTVSVQQAVLLSLGIDPHTIDDIKQQDAERLVNYWKFDAQSFENVDTEPIHHGQQEQDYQIRLAATTNAIAANVFSYHQTSDPRHANHIGLDAFIGFAKSKGWNMPDWLSSKGEPNTSKPTKLTGVRQEKKNKTAARNQGWQERAVKLRSDHPSYSNMRICEMIASENGSNRDANTIRNNIKIPPKKPA